MVEVWIQVKERTRGGRKFGVSDFKSAETTACRAEPVAD